MTKNRKIFVVVAGGGHDTDKHYHDTIKNKRTIDEASKFLDQPETTQLKESINNLPYIVWGAVPGLSNSRLWTIMEPGDYVMVTRGGKIILAAEIAYKTHNNKLAKYFWKTTKDGDTWEYIYFMINDINVNVSQKDFNKYIGFKENYFPRGFMAIDQGKVNKLLLEYGDLISLLQKLEAGQELEKVDVEKKKIFEEVLEEKIERAPTEHDEMQWRLIRLGALSNFKVWVPRNDQGKSFEGHNFRDLVMNEFHETIDVPSYIKNIDVVWKMGLSIKSAFEIENSTSIYSGILRLSDLRALAPNSSYPLFIVADRNKKQRVFDQLKRPTFSNDYLRLDKCVKFLGYERIRKLDEDLKDGNVGFDITWLTEQAESTI